MAFFCSSLLSSLLVRRSPVKTKERQRHTYLSLFRPASTLIPPTLFSSSLQVTACISVALTYFQLSGEDYRWWWRSIFGAGATGLFILAFAFFYYYGRSNMSGMLQVGGQIKMTRHALPFAAPELHPYSQCPALSLFADRAILWLHHTRVLHFLPYDGHHRIFQLAAVCALHVQEREAGLKAGIFSLYRFIFCMYKRQTIANQLQIQSFIETRRSSAKRPRKAYWSTCLCDLKLGNGEAQHDKDLLRQQALAEGQKEHCTADVHEQNFRKENEKEDGRESQLQKGTERLQRG